MKIKIKSLTLVLIIIASMVIGSYGTVLLMASGVGEHTFIPNEQLEALYEQIKSSGDENSDGKATAIINFLKKNYYVSTDVDALREGEYYGLVDSIGDVYSKYMNSDELLEYYDDFMGNNTYGGVGITFIDKYIEGKGYKAVAINSKGPAYAAGVKKGDYIYKVDGIDVKTYSTGESVLVDKIRGEIGTDVEMELVRPNGTHYTVVLTRAEITPESVEYDFYEDSRIAQITLSSFNYGSSEKEFAAALEKAYADGAVGLVVDLRDNGGGSVASAVNIADMLIDTGVVVTAYYNEASGNEPEVYRAKNEGRTSLPYVVLVNGYSASSSEILTCAIKDNKEGTIVGTQTYGKGIMQDLQVFSKTTNQAVDFNMFYVIMLNTPERVSDYYAVKYTCAQYYTPNGDAVHGIGITPDYLVEITDDCYDENGFLVTDTQLNFAIELLTNN